MWLIAIVFGSALWFVLAYKWYGSFLERWLQSDDANITPAHEQNDGVDFVPERASVLAGQHFSAIAAAGPIVGPILAATYFGWLPALLWILLGSVFIGGVHDMASLIASLRHKACSIAEIVRLRISKGAFNVFLLFIWTSLIYVIIAFADITTSSFAKISTFPEIQVAQAGGGTAPLTILGGGVATAALAYLVLSVLLGFAMRRNWSLWGSAAVATLLVGLVIWYGQQAPIQWPATWGDAGSNRAWNLTLMAYCFAASVLPMWLLLQPRGFLGGLFMYAVMAIGFIGVLVGGFTGKLDVQYPIWKASTEAMPMMPFLFITIACGACSGFHSIVSSGTTSKQLSRERDARPVAYGMMLAEGMVAVLALATMMILPAQTKAANPDVIFAQGLSTFLGLFGVSPQFAIVFALLAFTTFIFDTLDVCTRLGRYIFQELTGLPATRTSGLIATGATLLIPTLYLVNSEPGVWKQFWSIFGTSNQLLASLTLTGIAVWQRSLGRNPWPALLPALFMLGITSVGLYRNIQTFLAKLQITSGPAATTALANVVIASVVALLGCYVLFEAARVLFRPATAALPAAEPIAND